uniref:Peptidase_M13 domain-containing protein n=1 Tax=Caenorhabditis tropicalis TaxID=1561998 RepID=A0A1I7UUF2_9PELO
MDDNIRFINDKEIRKKEGMDCGFDKSFEVAGLVLTAGVLGVVIAILVNESSSTNNNNNYYNSNGTGTNTNTIYNETFVYNQTYVYNSTSSFNNTNTLNNTVVVVVNNTVVVDSGLKVLNVAAPNKIAPSSSQYNSYQQVVQLFKSSVNLSADPCNDFYAYTCGNFQGDMSFDISDDSNINDMVTQLTNDNYISTAPLPVKQTRWYFDQCIQARQNWNTIVASGSVVTNAINQLAAGTTGFPGTQFPFPMLDQSANVTWPGKFGLGYLAGSLTAQGVDTIISSGVDTNWKDPTGPDGFAYLLDQPTTFAPNTYYLKDWNDLQASLTTSITQTMLLLAQVQNKVLDPTILAKDVQDVINLDYVLAMNFSTDDTTRRQYDRSYNPNTLTQLRSQYHDDLFSWHMYLPLAVGSAEHVLDKLLNDPTYNYYIVMESAKLNMLLEALNDQNKYGITPRALINYFYYRLVDSLSNFLPWPQTSTVVRPFVKIQKPPVGRPRHVLPHERKYEIKEIADISEAQYSCAAETIDQMMYANARIFVDKIYPTADDRKNVREHVAKVASSIVIGFRSMIDQLNWMTSSTKKGAYNKIENLVKNIAYPDWITDDNQLTQYHTQMNFNQTNDYITMFFNAMNFNLWSQWDQLVQGAADRTGFNGPPGITNAWYQPELNSITFPAGILKKPFYDFNWPASVNFGAMGVIAGHELTHGFDDQGVQWNGVGTLNGWMDDQSKVSFTNMAQCVVDEYSGFCPLDKAKYGQAACIDGAQTQGENIADNGGIHSAFRAYKNYVDLYGPDPVLPDDTFQYFSPDQLFFLSFAQVWCQLPYKDSQFLRQILVDVHSPSIYRVLGTIQNFPAFKTAFNCPASTYAPDKHCNVWVSDIDTTYGLPNTQTDLNVAPEAPITSRDVDKMNAYQMASNYYSKSVNTKIDPCNDFYGYACGTFNQPVSFTTARAQNLIYMAQKLEDPAYQATIQGCPALTKEKQLYNACVTANVNAQTSDQLLISKNYIQTKVTALQGFLGTPFTLVAGGVPTLPSAKQLGDGLGYLSFEQGIDTLISPLVDTYWIDNTKGYQMFIDQNTAYWQKTYYQPAAWKIKKPQYYNMAYGVLQRYAKEQNIKLPDTFNDTLSKVLDYEQTIAIKYSTDDDTRRNFQRSWNLVKVSDLGKTYSFLDWVTYLGHAPTTVRTKVTDGNFQVSMMEVDRITHFSADYATQDPNLLVNLLYVRLILGNAEYIPSYKTEFQGITEESVFLGLSRRKTIPNNFPPSNDIAADGPACASVANNLMQFANGRVFVDYMYPTQADVDNIRASAGGIIKNVISSFQGMIDQLDWMSADTKKKAYDKTASIQQNIAFPDWIKNDTLLSNYYQDLVIADTDNYFDILDKLTRFNVELQYNQLNAAQTDRTDFLGQPGTVNAWYQPELNSITFPAGILVPPYFHPKWPPSINYGGMGLVAGHELTHGFDDQGVQWGPTGNLASWMDDNSYTGFKAMAQCVINEYNGFCPLNATQYTPNCVKGSQTQGENIADNGGIHAAFNAFKTHQALDGPDPRLPDRLFGQFTHDQLFFMSFAQVWCEVRRSDEALYTQIMVDPHSPSMYRVFGTIQNFPAFQTAFNCPLGSASAPTNHCEVWVPGKYQ